jgi:hypothetical protein
VAKGYWIPHVDVSKFEAYKPYPPIEHAIDANIG